MPTTLPIIQPRDIPKLRLAEYYNIYNALLSQNWQARCWNGFPAFFEEQMRDDREVSNAIRTWVTSWSDTFRLIGRLGHDIPDDKARHDAKTQEKINAAQKAAASAFVALAARLREIAARS